MAARAGTSGKRAAARPEVSAERAQQIAKAIVGEGPQRDHRERPRGRQYFARRPFGYGGVDLDREQVFELKGLVNDAKLVDLRYCAEVPEGATVCRCRLCAAQFLSLSALNAHGDRRHRAPKPPPVMEPRQPGETEQDYEVRERGFLASVASEEDRNIERQERMLEQVAPLDLTKTTASRMG